MTEEKVHLTNDEVDNKLGIFREPYKILILTGEVETAFADGGGWLPEIAVRSLSHLTLPIRDRAEKGFYVQPDEIQTKIEEKEDKMMGLWWDGFTSAQKNSDGGKDYFRHVIYIPLRSIIDVWREPIIDE